MQINPESYFKGNNPFNYQLKKKAFFFFFSRSARSTAVSRVKLLLISNIWLCQKWPLWQRVINERPFCAFDCSCTWFPFIPAGLRGEVKVWRWRSRPPGRSWTSERFWSFYSFFSHFWQQTFLFITVLNQTYLYLRPKVTVLFLVRRRCNHHRIGNRGRSAVIDGAVVTQ